MATAPVIKTSTEMYATKVHDPSDKDGWYRITPEYAQFLLDTRQKNRELSDSRASAIASQILQGDWRANGESIVLDSQGRMCDGQHRCKAVVISKVPIVSYMVKVHDHMDSGAFDSIDRGRSRTAADRLYLDDVSNHNLIAALTKRVLGWERGWRGSTAGRYGITVTDVRERYESDSELLQLVARMIVNRTPALKGMAAPSIIGMVLYFAWQRNPDKATKWIDGLCTGANLEVGDPALTLRTRLLSDRSKNVGRMSGVNVLVATIRSWNSYYLGKKLTIIKAGVIDDKEFPEFED